MKVSWLITLIYILFLTNLNAQFRTKQILGAHAVLQRDVESSIKGWGQPGVEVKVSLDGSDYSSTVSEDGSWEVKIPARPAGGPYELKVKSGMDGLIYTDLYFGDVWLCSGQSNMEWPLKNTENAEEEIAEANDRMIRHFKVPRLNEEEPVSDLPSGEWQVLSPETAGDFTAVGYYFAKSIRENNNVPIGLLNSSWGGSRIEPWMSAETLDSKHPEYSKAVYVKENNMDFKAQEASLKKRFPSISEDDAGMKDGKPLWVSDKTSGLWEKINPEKLWEEQGYELVDGVAYYRTYFDSDGSNTVLKLGKIDDNDMTWVNGQLVGATNGYAADRTYEVSSAVLQKGQNELLIRVEDNTGGGGLYASDFETSIGDLPFTNFDWEIRLGALRMNTLSNKIPNIIYNAMIHPIIDFPIKGVIWYQGESNAGNLETAHDYRFLLESLIGQWRTDWKNPELPFYYVQLANFREPMKEPGSDPWAVIRESMTEVLKVPGTGQAVIIDIGNADDIHPRNKRDVGYRLALPALHDVYGEDVIPGSPMYASHEVVGNHVVVNFKQIGSGLEVRDRYGYVNGFSIAGKDGKYVWAKAKLEGDKVIVWSEEVAAPVSLRYAWETNPFDVNLFNKEGLPVTPFRFGEE